MQHFLRTLGLDRSYLFLNSFVYPIFNQYTPDLKVIAQNPVSPIAAHRNQILDKAIVAGDVRLVIAVGNAAKESVASWIKTHGGNAQPGSLHEATMGNLPNRVRAVGVKHPGAAVGGSIEDIKDSFQAAQDQIKEWLDDDPTWPRSRRHGPQPDRRIQVQIRRDPVPRLPVRDRPRLGRGATSSNRSNGQRAIRLFSAGGVCAAKGAHLSDPTTAGGTNVGYDDDPGDLPYEPPRNDVN